MRRLRLLFILLAATSLSAASPVAELCPVQQTLYARSALRMRVAPSTSSALVGTIPRGRLVSVGTCSSGWCEVRYAGRSGYSSARYLTPLPPLSATGRVRTPRAARSCCRICTRGKACGNSCISRRYTCHRGRGCACNG